MRIITVNTTMDKHRHILDRALDKETLAQFSSYLQANAEGGAVIDHTTFHVHDDNMPVIYFNVWYNVPHSGNFQVFIHPSPNDTPSTLLDLTRMFSN